jgi:hypothetical protein
VVLNSLSTGEIYLLSFCYHHYYYCYVLTLTSCQLFQNRKGPRPSLFPDITQRLKLTTLKAKLSLNKLVCTGLKTKFNTYASFRVSVLGNDFPLINNTGVWRTGCLTAPFYGKLTPDQVYSSSTPLKLIEDGASSVAACRPINSNTLSLAGTHETRAGSGLNS